MIKLTVLVLVLAGCEKRQVDVGDDLGVNNTVEPDATVRAEGVSYPGYFPQSIERDLDVLFVIDNTVSMEQEQANLSSSLAELVEALRSETFGADGTGRPCNERDRSGCAIPNLHIGVVSTDLGAGPYTTIPNCEAVGGDGGKLQSTPRVAGCTPPNKRYISFIDGKINVGGDQSDPIEAVKEAFTCISKLGGYGCDFEQPLESARRALNPENKINDGFIRKDAFLAILFITDEDDCSAKNLQLFDPTQSALTDPLGPLSDFRCFEKGIQCDINDRMIIGPRKNCIPAFDWLYDLEHRYVDFFRDLKRPGRLLVAAISGPTDRVEVGKAGGKPVLKQSCQSRHGLAIPAIRIKALVDAFRPDSQFTSICEQSFGPALRVLGKRILGKMGSQCFASALLTRTSGVVCQEGDQLAPGIQCRTSCLHDADCDVIDIIGQGTSSEKTFVVEKCPRALWYPRDWREDRDCGSSCPCWRIVKKQACDPQINGTPYALDILREGTVEKGTVAEARCSTSSKTWNSVELGQFPQCTVQE